LPLYRAGADAASVPPSQSFEDLVAEGASVPVHGWDFSWFNGRASEERPSWGYSRLVGVRMAHVVSALDIQTGGGEVLAEIPQRPAVLIATESWPPNVDVAAGNLRPLGACVVATADEPSFPFRADAFDLVVSRHPVNTWWAEIARVLRPGGTFLSQQIGAGQQRELCEAMLGPLPPSSPRRYAEMAAAAAEAAGLVVVDLRCETLRAVFYDIAAVVYFLRKVIWTVPDFTVEGYRDQLEHLHERIQTEGAFISHAQRFLIEARKPY
jgi:SAM-dependent methyltransferase